MPEDEHRPVRARAELVEPLELLVADLARVPALDDRVEHGEGDARQLAAPGRLGGKAAAREGVVVAAHVQEPLPEGAEIALQEGVVLAHQPRGGEVALGDDGRRVDSRRSL